MTKYTTQNMLDAMSAASGGGQKRKSVQSPNPSPVSVNTQTESSSPPPVNISFTIEKKVGSATIHAYGHDITQAEEAKEKVRAAARHLKGA